MRPLVFLADLTHTGQIVASNVAPLGIGLIASHLKKHADAEIELFKYPHDLSRALNECANRGEFPEVVGFANYSWNCELAYAYAEKIKAASPKTTIVFGGPNYGLSEGELTEFWRNHPLIDFHIVLEGELAFLELFKKLSRHDFDNRVLKNAAEAPANCHFLKGDELVKGPMLPRVKDLNELGSPYLEGLMDKFFDGVLIPMIHTTRGCPFTCAFCTEGNSYYSKVAQRSQIEEELRYIAQRRGSVQDLVITDANFGMYLDDQPKAKIIAKIQEEFHWPKRILVSTGKNQKERIIEVAATLKGAIHIAASLQSTNEEVLKNVKRSNISLEALNTIVKQSNDAETPTYTEVILALPGDSFERHLQSIRDVTNAGLGIVRMYQLILLPQTELNTPETRQKFSMKTKFRINPRSFGRYEILGESKCSVEFEEICVSNATLSEEDYFKARELDLTVEVLHNTGMFFELMGLARKFDVPWFDFLVSFFEKRREFGPDIASLYDTFTRESKSRLWNSKEELQTQVEAEMDRYLGDPSGTNEMAMSKAVAFFKLERQLHDHLFGLMKETLRQKGILDEVMALYLEDLKKYSLGKKSNFVQTDCESVESLNFDFHAIREKAFEVNPSEYLLRPSESFRFFHSPNQKDTIRGYVTQYGTTIDGLGRILMRAPVRTLFRDIAPAKDVGSGLMMNSFG